MTDRVRGVVKDFNAATGFGFIGQGDEKLDVFVHYTEIEGTGYKELVKGDEVEFAIVPNGDKLKAVDVKLISRKMDKVPMVHRIVAYVVNGTAVDKVAGVDPEKQLGAVLSDIRRRLMAGPEGKISFEVVLEGSS